MTRSARRHGGSLTRSFIVLIGVVISAVLLVYLSWSIAGHRSAVQDKALAEARVLNAEMGAIWDYINAQQDRINYNADGHYDFKGVYCTIAAKNVAQRFMQRTDYVIRYVRENPRSGTDEPDAFELEAIEAWRSNEDAEHYAFTTFGGEPALRYSSVLLAERNCLNCHGEPAGELDEVGFIKEGMKYGDLAGLTSIVIPMSAYEQEVQGFIVRDVLLTASLVTIVGLTIFVALRRWVVRPLTKLDATARSIGGGDFSADLTHLGAKREIQDLATDISQMAAELQELYGSLEAKVHARTVELEEANQKLSQMNVKLQEANAYKSNFLTIVSHELRTPLTAIIAFADILLAASHGDDDTATIAREIKENARSLLAMINNVIDAAKLETGRYQMHYAPVDLVDVVLEVEKMVYPLAERKGLRLTSSVATDVPVIQSDADALHKILANLVSNAVKFTDAGGRVDIRAFCDEDGTSVVLEVRDTGIGISEDDLALIFERFAQPDASLSRAHGGSGLGLSLVKELAEEMGGSVAVQSEPGKGSLFTVMLPLVGQEERTDDKDSLC